MWLITICDLNAENFVHSNRSGDILYTFCKVCWPLQKVSRGNRSSAKIIIRNPSHSKPKGTSVWFGWLPESSVRMHWLDTWEHTDACSHAFAYGGPISLRLQIHWLKTFFFYMECGWKTQIHMNTHTTLAHHSALNASESLSSNPKLLKLSGSWHGRGKKRAFSSTPCGKWKCSKSCNWCQLCNVLQQAKQHIDWS